MRKMTGKTIGVTSSGRGKQFAGSGSPGPFLKKTVPKATAAMSNAAMPTEAPSTSMARKDAKKNTVKGGGRRVF